MFSLLHLNLTRLECKGSDTITFQLSGFDLNLTRLECKAHSWNTNRKCSNNLNLTRLECKVANCIVLAEGDNKFEFNQIGM